MATKFSPEVERAIAEVCPPRDPFDSASFDPIEYLNQRFSDESSLIALPTFIDETNRHLRQTEHDLLKAVEAQAINATDAESDLVGAKLAVEELYERVSDIKTKASQSEETVKELCHHIRELDTAKTNLTTSINTLRSIQLWMLQLQALSTAFDRRRYIQCRDALQEAKKYSASFEPMKDLPKVKELNDKQSQLCRQIEYYIRNTVFADPNAEDMDESAMADACAVVDLMDKTCVQKIRDRFIEKALETYGMRFKRGTDDAKLERTERRYVYIRTLLEHYSGLFKRVFPKHWCVPQELCVTFCLRTKDELDFQLRESVGTMDIAVLTYVLQKTSDIERDLTQMMAWKDDFSGRDELPVYRYNGMILSAFKEHMGVFVRNEDKLMGDALAQPLIGSGDATCHGWNGEEDVRVGATLSMAEDIFVFIKESLKRSLRTSQQDVLLDMAAVWRKHLIRFANSMAALLPNPAATPIQIRHACIIVNTADMCQATSNDLGDEVCARSEAPAREVAFNQVVDTFAALYSRSVLAIVHGVERTLSPLMVQYDSGAFMTKRDRDSPQDESPLVRGMTTILHDMVLNCAAVLSTATLRFLLDKTAAAVIPRYSNSLYRLKHISVEAVSAMRVDSAAFEKVFLQLPNYNDPERFPASQLTSYMKLVRREFDELNRALKILQVDARAASFIDVYYEVTLPEDRSIQNFVRLVELKGLTREEVRSSIAKLSKRGVVEATRRDLVREQALSIATGSAAAPNASSTNTTAPASPAGGGGISFTAFLSRDSGSSGAQATGGSAATGSGGTAQGAASPTATGASTGFSLSNFMSNIGGGDAKAAAAVAAQANASASSPTGKAGSASAGGAAGQEETLGSRFANNIFSKFKKGEDGKDKK